MPAVEEHADHLTHGDGGEGEEEGEADEVQLLDVPVHLNHQSKQ